MHIYIYIASRSIAMCATRDYVSAGVKSIGCTPVQVTRMCSRSCPFDLDSNVRELPEKPNRETAFGTYLHPVARIKVKLEFACIQEVRNSNVRARARTRENLRLHPYFLSKPGTICATSVYALRTPSHTLMYAHIPPFSYTCAHLHIWEINRTCSMSRYVDHSDR